ncbi:hypothetical protein EAH88_11735 [Rhodanobacter glycinis]|uniref:Uncharacterized protein n=1 Tax=Rhodanobacter glycinis TaxID=582702 RepID=A0A502C5X0_9GAMM|nr:hypothetical protein [Rhodanobacter glycinis]TPG08298.1 hypothetical protein EAH88_11735 [Rhodanobacter glycinis]
MTTTWASSHIQIQGELHVDVKASADTVTLGTYNDAVQASDLVLTPEQAMEIADALTAAATFLLANKGG